MYVLYSQIAMDSSITTAAATEVRGIRKWFLWALVISLGFHALLFLYLQIQRLEHFQADETETLRLVARAQFKGGRASFPAGTFDEPKETKTPDLAKAAVPHPEVPAPLPQKPSAADVPDTLTLTPKATDLAKQLAAQKPAIDAEKKMASAPSQERAVQSDLDSALKKQLLDGQPANPGAHSQIKLPGGHGAGEGTETGSGQFSNLDGLLEQGGQLKGPVAPVNMPGGALFEYNSAALLPDAIETLRKLGTLITRNPRATFSIEGHTDSFGTPEYNLKLSIARADSVRSWLITNMHIDPAQIQSKGFGSTRLIAPASGSKGAQAINRRVEIVIRTPRQ